ncbi:polysaccharide biosynthesis tyrosine autokinase [Limnoglobus roseus]|uniref:Exopolysaccharide biosynthesis protein n=1 Tax=Limnoglobus roseus TaxID=2598579 RepID=A0A5C1AGE3_9BACT|nr:polysaccharide biosynthesis tyrosine autokinase [Limnoglobus roseus]QEL17217.1 exopolysaccharide biosynthesis protein [Limnoglobus roseus]
MRRSPEGDQQGNAALAQYSAPTYSIPGGAYSAAPSPVSLPSPVGNRNVPTFMGLLNALKRRWVLASFLGLLVAAAAAVALWIAAPQGKHQVKALLEITPENVGLMPGANQQNDSNTSNFKENQMVLIKTRTILTRVVQNEKLKDTQLVKTSDDPAKVIEDMLRLRWEAPDLMAVTMNGDRPDELKEVLDVLVQTFKAESSAKETERRRAQKDILVKLREKYQKDIDDIMRAGHLRGDMNAPQTPEMFNEKVKDVGDELRKARSAKREAEVKLAALDDQVKAANDEAASLQTKKFTDEQIEAALLRDKEPALVGFQAELEVAQAKLKARQGAYKDADNPRIVEVQDEIKDIIARRAALTSQRRSDVETKLRAERRDEIEKGQRLIQIERTTAQSNLTKYSQAVTELESRLEVMNRMGIEVIKQDREIKPKMEQKQKIEEQIEQLNLWLSSGGRIEIREKAVIMYNHNQRQKMLYSGMIGVAMFLVVLTLVAFLEWRTRRVDGVDQVVNEIGMRVIGTIPAFPSRQSIKTGEADANQNWRFILNESVNSTRTMLLHTAKTQSMQVIMVTSAMQGEGKTSLSSQLATSMATAGLRTLIVDCDLRNPSMHRLFDLPLAPGCSEILLSELDVSDAVQPTTVPNLWVIPAGQCSNRVISALAQGHQLESLFNRLRGQFDFIVVDSCPVLPVADTLLIGQHVDGVLISILQDISQLPKVLDASDRLSQLNIPLLGAVVNGIKTDIHAYGYNYVKQLPA